MNEMMNYKAKPIGICRCGSYVYTNDYSEYEDPDAYTGQCFECDEDLFSFEIGRCT